MTNTQKLTQAGKEVNQMTKKFIPTIEQVTECLRYSALREILDEHSVDLLNPGNANQGVALEDIKDEILELSYMKTFNEIVSFLSERGYDIISVALLVIDAFRLPTDQAQALQATLKMLPTQGWLS